MEVVAGMGKIQGGGSEDCIEGFNGPEHKSTTVIPSVARNLAFIRVLDYVKADPSLCSGRPVLRNAMRVILQ